MFPVCSHDEVLLRLVADLGFCDTEYSANRKKCVMFLERLGTKWVTEVTRKMGHCVNFGSPNLPCRVLLHGSTALGFISKYCDVDAILVVPNFVDREEFFASFFSCLKEQAEVSDLVAVQDTFVPLIKMKIFNVCVDLVVSRLGTPFVPIVLDFDQLPCDLYRDMDHISIRSLSGFHLTQVVKDLTADYPLFPWLLRIVRAWVKARCLGSYIYGFPPTVAWTILVVHVCKRVCSPTASQLSFLCICDGHSTLPETNPGCGDISTSSNVSHTLFCLVHAFFAQFAHWSWPNPVQIAPIRFFPELGVSSWKPQQFPRDERDLMPIITPVFPHVNAAFTVRSVTRVIVSKELERGHKVVLSAIQDKSDWKELFQRYDVRDEYRHFLLLTFNASSREELNVAGGLVDTRLRDLAQILEDEECIYSTRIAPVQPSNGDVTTYRPTGGTYSNHDNYIRQWLIAMGIEPGPRLSDGHRSQRTVDITGCLATFYAILRERDCATDFSDKLTHLYLKRLQTLDFVL